MRARSFNQSVKRRNYSTCSIK